MFIIDHLGVSVGASMARTEEEGRIANQGRKVVYRLGGILYRCISALAGFWLNYLLSLIPKLLSWTYYGIWYWLYIRICSK